MSEIRKNCFAYNREQNDCDAFIEMFCKYKDCKFYQEEYMKRQINRDIREYSKKVNGGTND